IERWLPPNSYSWGVTTFQEMYHQVKGDGGVSDEHALAEVRMMMFFDSLVSGRKNQAMSDQVHDHACLWSCAIHDEMLDQAAGDRQRKLEILGGYGIQLKVISCYMQRGEIRAAYKLYWQLAMKSLHGRNAELLARSRSVLDQVLSDL